MDHAIDVVCFHDSHYANSIDLTVNMECGHFDNDANIFSRFIDGLY